LTGARQNDVGSLTGFIGENSIV